jgi:hypothetical protein
MMDAAMSVHVVQHAHIDEDGGQCIKMIGVYESRNAAEDAVKRLATKPGFREFPTIIDPLHDEDESGFYIDEYRIGEDHWTDGFVTVS